MASAAINDRVSAESPEPDALKRLLQQFQELGEYASYYAAAKTDSFELSLRNTILWIVLAALGFIGVGGLLVAAGWLLLVGVAEGLGVLFGDRLWVGNLLTGTLLLAGLGSGMYGLVVARKRAARKRTVEKYSKRQTRQQTRYGHTVSAARHAAVPRQSERRFLHDQAGDAKMAMRRTLHELKQTARNVADVRSSARQHPWLVTGSVAAAGFVAGTVMTTSPRDRNRPTPARSESGGEPVDHKQKPTYTETSSVASSVRTALTGAVIRVLQGVLTAAAVSLFAKDEESNGTCPSDDTQKDGEFQVATN